MQANKRRAGSRKGTSSHQVHEAIRKRILRVEMLPGEDIDEAALVSEFGVSRTPVREALVRLAKDGFVRLRPNRGAIVSPLELGEIPQLLEALELSLRATTRWAAVRRTANDLKIIESHKKEWDEAVAANDFIAMSETNNAFHMAIAESAGNFYVANLYASLLPGFFRLSISLLSPTKLGDYKAYYAKISDEHARMVQAIKDQDADAADRLAEQHSMLMREKVVDYFQSSLSGEVVLSGPKEAKR